MSGYSYSTGYGTGAYDAYSGYGTASGSYTSSGSYGAAVASGGYGTNIYGTESSSSPYGRYGTGITKCHLLSLCYESNTAPALFFEKIRQYNMQMSY